MVYVSITGLRLKSFVFAPVFAWHALRSMAQAHRAPGNRLAQARTINGVHHTLSVWDDEAAMRAYLVSGPHRDALRVFHRIATGKTLGYSAETAPDWSEVHAIWIQHARSVDPR